LVQVRLDPSQPRSCTPYAPHPRGGAGHGPDAGWGPGRSRRPG
jgi:hypothetical protein